MDWFMHILIALIVSVFVIWALLLAFFIVNRPPGNSAMSGIGLMADCAKMFHRLAKDKALPRGVHVRMWILTTYLALPFDIIPDFLPVIGYADDVVVTIVILRSVVRACGVEVLERNWPGRPEGLDALLRIARIERPSIPT